MLIEYMKNNKISVAITEETKFLIEEAGTSIYARIYVVDLQHVASILKFTLAL